MFDGSERIETAPVDERIRQITTDTSPLHLPVMNAGGVIARMVGADGCCSPACQGPLAGSV